MALDAGRGRFRRWTDPIAFGFTSFDGAIVIPNWPGYIPTLEIVLDNKGSYITNADHIYEQRLENHCEQVRHRGLEEELRRFP